MTESTNIQVSMNTHSRLSEIGRKGESFDHIVERLLDGSKRIHELESELAAINSVLRENVK